MRSFKPSDRHQERVCAPPESCVQSVGDHPFVLAFVWQAFEDEKRFGCGGTVA
jgi:hypothetical protein